MRTILCILLLCALAGLAIADTQATGKWSGTFSITSAGGDAKDTTAYLVLKQNGAEITGTVGPNEDEQYPIVKGKIEGNTITLEVEHQEHAIKFDLVLAEDRITGQANMSAEGQTLSGKLNVTRAK